MNEEKSDRFWSLFLLSYAVGYGIISPIRDIAEGGILVPRFHHVAMT